MKTPTKKHPLKKLGIEMIALKGDELKAVVPAPVIKQGGPLMDGRPVRMRLSDHI